MKASVVIAVLNSHEIVRRQMLHFTRMALPIEIILVDDGSVPPIEAKGATVLRTNDTRPWTQPMARNLGVKMAHGEYVICTDIDHVLPKEAIECVLNIDYDVVRFKRFVGVLDEQGHLTQDRETLARYGYPPDRGLRISAHGNSYAIKRDLFLELGGSQQKERYPNQDEVLLKRKLKKLAQEGKVRIIPDDDRPPIYLIPNGRYSGDRNANPFGLFHELKR